nr:hypothetical protein BHI3_07820 [Bacteriovorax sp. HI3]
MVEIPEMQSDHLAKLRYLRTRMGELTLSEKVFIESIVDNKPLDGDQAFMLNITYQNVKESDGLLLPKDHGIHIVESFESCGRAV